MPSKAKKFFKWFFIVLGAIILALVILVYCDLNDQPEKAIKTASAKRQAAVYYREKYGERLKVKETEALFSGGFMFYGGSIVGIEIKAEDCTLYVSTEDGYIADDKQYDEIYGDFIDKYINDPQLGSEYKIEYSDLSVNADRCRDFRSRCTDVKYNGDIEEFFSKADTSVDLRVSYTGYPDKKDEYPGMLDKKLDGLSAVPADYMKFLIYVKDPELDLPEVPNKVSAGQLLDFPQYEEYMELISCCSGEKRSGGEFEKNIYQIDFYDIDEYTAVSDNNTATPVRSENDFIFREHDLSEDTTAYRGRYRHDDRAEENILTVRETGYEFGLKERLHDCMFRFDREHYGITDKTVPLIVTDIITVKNNRREDWIGKRFYISAGYEPYDSGGEHWYYLDDEYLYLYINHITYDLFGLYETASDGSGGIYIAFADVE